MNNGKEIKFRGPGDIKRSVNEIAPEELADGMYEIIKQNLTVDILGLFRIMAEQCGAYRGGHAINEALSSALFDNLKDRVDFNGEQISIKQVLDEKDTHEVIFT